MTRMAILLNVNGEEFPLDVEPHRTLLEVLREDLSLKGTKANCQEGECGACTVMVDGLAVNACLYLAVRADRKRIVTIEGLVGKDGLHPLQEAFVRHGGVQCGYCTPGFIVSAAALLQANPHPSEDELAQALVGNICRCTGYVAIRQAVRSVAGSQEAGS